MKLKLYLTKDPKVDLLQLPDIEAVINLFSNVLTTMGKSYTAMKSNKEEKQDMKLSKDAESMSNKTNDKEDDTSETGNAKKDAQDFRQGPRGKARRKRK